MNEETTFEPTELGYTLLRIVDKYELFMLYGTDDAGSYKIDWNNKKVVLCLKKEILSALLFSNDSISTGFVKFYMCTFSFFTTHEIVYQFILDNKSIKEKNIKIL